MADNVLDKIFRTKREEVEAAKALVPMADLKSMAADAPPTRGFAQALVTGPRIGLIAEIKKASPSQGLIRADFDAVEIARIYEANGANCLSVLTDSPYFQGAPEYLTAARAATSLPALRKDFIADPYQVYQARAWHADAILLIVAALDDGQMIELQGLAANLGMDTLVETHTEEEAARAIDIGATLIGVNNRNLSDFTTSMEISERILPMLQPYATTVAESALETADDVARMQRAGAQAVLIGTTFTASPDIGAKVREVMGSAN